jgi:predicted phage terminase large subunit-like protein
MTALQPRQAPSLAEAAQQLLLLKNASTSFYGYVRLIHPEWVIPPFHYVLITALDNLEKRTLYSDFNRWAQKVLATPAELIAKHPSRYAYRPNLAKGHRVYNIMINMPPRHSKSTYATELFPAYYMARNPTRYVMSASYNTELAKGFGRNVRTNLADHRTAQAFPDFGFSQDSRAADTFKTTLMGQYFGVGLGGTTSGRPSTCLILDDPIKSRSEAESATQRNNTWAYYTSALSTRLQPEQDGTPAIQIICYTRWHPDDLGSRIMQTEDWAEGRWLHLSMPALVTATSDVRARVDTLPQDDPRYIPSEKCSAAPKEKRYYFPTKRLALWPERFPVEELERRERLSPRDFGALYQQQPTIEGGNLIKSVWWQYYKEDELDYSRFAGIIITLDTAFKKTETADYSVAVVSAITHDGDIFFLEVHRHKFDFPELKAFAISLNNKWRGKGLRALYIEDKASGQSLIQELRRESGISVVPFKVSTDKVSRANAVTPLIEGGRVYLPARAKWLDTFVNECSQFPSGKYDDQVDATVMAIDIHSKTSISPTMASGSLTGIGSLHAQVGSLSTSLASSGSWTNWGE